MSTPLSCVSLLLLLLVLAVLASTIHRDLGSDVSRYRCNQLIMVFSSYEIQMMSSGFRFHGAF